MIYSSTSRGLTSGEVWLAQAPEDPEVEILGRG